MQTESVVQPQPAALPQLTTGRIFVRGSIAAVIATVVNIVIGQVALLLGASQLPMLSPAPIALFTLVGVLGATIVFWLLWRFTVRPIRIFQIVAVVVLLVSIVPDFLLLGMPNNGGPSQGVPAQNQQSQGDLPQPPNGALPENGQRGTTGQPPNGMPQMGAGMGGSLPVTVGSLILMHIAAAAIAVGALTSQRQQTAAT